MNIFIVYEDYYKIDKEGNENAIFNILEAFETEEKARNYIEERTGFGFEKKASFGLRYKKLEVR
jgi:hypothetical protein